MSEEKIVFPGGALKLEGILSIPDGIHPLPVVVLCHPHPLYGGDMYDSVISTIAQALLNRGIVAFRFNFRGVGESEGGYGKGKGEQDDAIAAVDHVASRTEISADRIGLAGYSFGGGVAFSVASKDGRVRALALVSPVIPDSGWRKLGLYSIPKFVALGDSDEYFPISEYESRLRANLRQEEYTIFPGADHLWTGSETILAECVASFFATKLI